MKHILLLAAQYKEKGWVKNARTFAEDHPILMATGGLIGGALCALGGRSAAPPSPSAPSMPVAPRREAVASSNTSSELPVHLGNTRGLESKNDEEHDDLPYG